MSETILLVDDNAGLRDLLAPTLRFCGYTVLEAVDGVEGIRRAKEELPDVILMDISIPLVDGWQATRTLKADPTTRHIPIVALTAHAREADRERAREAGCDGYLSKPAVPRAVAAEVERMLRKRDD